MMIRSWTAAAVAATWLAAAGCNTPTEVCTMEEVVAITPAEKTIRVGQSFQAKAESITCSGRDHSPYTVTWQTADAAIIHLDPATGRITGIAPGAATVTAQEPSDPPWTIAIIHVTVKP